MLNSYFKYFCKFVHNSNNNNNNNNNNNKKRVRGGDSKNGSSFSFSSSGHRHSHAGFYPLPNLIVAQKRLLVRREVLDVYQAKNGFGNSHLGIDTEPLVK